MGWIHERHMSEGGSLNRNPSNNGSKKGPLRKVVQIISGGNDLFSRCLARLECGHEVMCTGGVRARCRKCKMEAETPPAASPTTAPE